MKCPKICSPHCEGTGDTCNKWNGVCHNGCMMGFGGDRCVSGRLFGDCVSLVRLFGDFMSPVGYLEIVCLW